MKSLVRRLKYWTNAIDTVKINILSREVSVVLEKWIYDSEDGTESYSSATSATIESGYIKDHAPDSDSNDFLHNYVYQYAAVQVDKDSSESAASALESQVKIEYIEQKGDGIYYYVLNDKSGVGTKLGEKDRIVLHYSSGITVTSVIEFPDGGEDEELNRFWGLEKNYETGEEFEFAMNYVRGYDVESVVITPTHEEDNETFYKAAGAYSYTLEPISSMDNNHQYKVPEGIACVDITVTATITRQKTASFDWSQWVDSDYPYTNGGGARYHDITAGGTGGDGTDATTSGTTVSADASGNGATLTWEFTTKASSYVENSDYYEKNGFFVDWQMDSLKIGKADGTEDEAQYLTLPLIRVAGESKKTYLFTDNSNYSNSQTEEEDKAHCYAVVEVVKVEEKSFTYNSGKKSKTCNETTYRVTIYNAKEDLKIFAANLNGGETWSEIIPTADDHIEFSSNAATLNTPTPFGAEWKQQKKETTGDANYWTQAKGGLYQFAAKDGCYNVTVTMSLYSADGQTKTVQTLSESSDGSLDGKTFTATLDGAETTVATIYSVSGEDGKYMIVFNKTYGSADDSKKSATLFEVEFSATKEIYHVYYDPTEGSWSSSAVEDKNVGADGSVDAWSFDLINNNIVTVTNKKPVSSSSTRVLAGWSLNPKATAESDGVLAASTTLDLTDPEIRALIDTENDPYRDAGYESAGCLHLYAVYADKPVDEKAVTVYIKTYLQQDDGTFVEEETMQNTVYGVDTAEQTVLNIKDYDGYTYVSQMTDATGADVDVSNETITIHKGAEDGTTINLYYMKELPVTITATGLQEDYTGEPQAPYYTISMPASYRVVFTDPLSGKTLDTYNLDTDAGDTIETDGTRTTITIHSKKTYTHVDDTKEDGKYIEIELGEETTGSSELTPADTVQVFNDMSYYVYDSTGNVKVSYVDLEVENGIVEIDPIPLTITTGSASKPYDGTELTYDSSSAEGLVNGEKVIITVKGLPDGSGKQPELVRDYVRRQRRFSDGISDKGSEGCEKKSQCGSRNSSDE